MSEENVEAVEATEATPILNPDGSCPHDKEQAFVDFIQEFGAFVDGRFCLSQSLSKDYADKLDGKAREDFLSEIARVEGLIADNGLLDQETINDLNTIKGILDGLSNSDLTLITQLTTNVANLQSLYEELNTKVTVCRTDIDALIQENADQAKEIEALKNRPTGLTKAEYDCAEAGTLIKMSNALRALAGQAPASCNVYPSDVDAGSSVPAAFTEAGEDVDEQADNTDSNDGGADSHQDLDIGV